MKNKAIGIDIGGTNMRVAYVDATDGVVEVLKNKTPIALGPEGTVTLLSEMIHAIQTTHGKDGVLGVGIGCPGPLSRQKKMIFQTPNLPGFDGFPLGTRLEERVGLPVWMDNDAKCATYGEGLFGAAKGLKNYCLLTLGTGIGGGVIQDGRMIYGKSDGACEIGHMTLYPEGHLCKCGNRGCFEQYCSATAIERRMKQALGRPASPRELFPALDNNEMWARLVIEEVAHDLSIGIASLVNIFDPEAVILGGGIFASGGGPLASMISEGIKERCFKSSQKGLKISASGLGGYSGVVGAASLVFRASEPDQRPL